MGRPWIVMAVAATLTACGPSPKDSDGVSGTTEAEPGSTGDPTAADSTSDGSPSFPSPDCATVLLPGDPESIAASPRADRDAEILALLLSPSDVAARQDRYELIAADLQSIREQQPALADVHVSCVVPRGYAFGGGQEIVHVVGMGQYHTWDCHNAFYGIRYTAPGIDSDVWRADGLVIGMNVRPVLDPDTFMAVYGGMPWASEVGDFGLAHPFWEDGVFSSSCEPTDGQLTLTADAATVDAQGQRVYTFEHPELGPVRYVATGTEPPVPAP